MSEINNICTYSSKFWYYVSSLIQPTDGVNNFKGTYHLAETHSFTEKLTSKEITIRIRPSTTDQITFCHVHGTVTKDISKGISFYSVNNDFTNGSTYHRHTTIATPANPNSNIDYIDYIWIPPPKYAAYIIMYFKTHDANSAIMQSTQVELNITYDFYCL